MRSLEWLSLEQTNVRDLTPISAIDSLASIRISGKQVSALNELMAVQSLKEVDIVEPTEVDISPVAYLPNLETLSIVGPPRIDLSWLRRKRPEKLTTFGIMGLQFMSRVMDADAIGELRSLRSLSLASVDVTSLSFATNLKELKDLFISNCQIRDISVVGSLESLQNVSLMLVPIVDVSPLLSLPKLKTLNITKTPARSDVVSQLERRGVVVYK